MKVICKIRIQSDFMWFDILAKKEFTDVKLPFLHREIGSTIRARVNGQICNDFLYDRNIDDEFLYDRNIDDEICSGNLKIFKSLFHFLSY